MSLFRRLVIKDLLENGDIPVVIADDDDDDDDDDDEDGGKDAVRLNDGCCCRC